MTVLSSKKILQEHNTNNPDSITSLTLTHKALSDVSCLSDFKNLERLDLGFNSLISLEGLKSCVNLKWLSVVQNKLKSLKGIESLTKLTVLNAGKNKLKSINEAKSLGSLRALILNDNEISSVCKLDQMKELNTLVLSRNPIGLLGDSLVKLKSITKLSLSNCQLETVDSSLKSCLELKELRLAHNDIMTVPGEFGNLVKLQNLDMGNNLITHWSNLKVLSSLFNLRNLNLQGNPIAEKENLLKKVKKLLPNLHIFNARPIEDVAVKEAHEKAPLSDGMHNHLNKNENQSSRNKRKVLQDENGIETTETANTPEKKKKKNLKLQHGELGVKPEKGKKLKYKKQKNNQLPDEPDVEPGTVGEGEEPDKKSRKKCGDNVNIIDSAESPFMDLFTTAAPEVPLETAENNVGHKTDQAINVSGVVTLPKKKNKNRVVDPSALELLRVDEIGLGGPSAWDDV